MKILKGKVIDGRIEIVDGDLSEGALVTVLVSESERAFTLTDDEVAELQVSIDQASRGEVVDGWQLLEELRS